MGKDKKKKSDEDKSMWPVSQERGDLDPDSRYFVIFNNGVIFDGPGKITNTLGELRVIQVEGSRTVSAEINRSAVSMWMNYTEGGELDDYIFCVPENA